MIPEFEIFGKSTSIPSFRTCMPELASCSVYRCIILLFAATTLAMESRASFLPSITTIFEIYSPPLQIENKLRFHHNSTSNPTRSQLRLTTSYTSCIELSKLHVNQPISKSQAPHQIHQTPAIRHCTSLQAYPSPLNHEHHQNVGSTRESLYEDGSAS